VLVVKFLPSRVKFFALTGGAKHGVGLIELGHDFRIKEFLLGMPIRMVFLCQRFVRRFNHLVFSGMQQPQDLVQILHTSTSQRMETEGFDTGVVKVRLPEI
jgi:hypothetical protein